MPLTKRQKSAPSQQSRFAHRNLPGAGTNYSTARFGNLSQRKDTEKSFHAKSYNKQPLNLDDISLSSDDSQQSYERFLKKEDSTGKKTHERIKTSKERPTTSRGSKIREAPAKVSTSNALNRLAALEAKIKSRQVTNRLSLSGSDFGLDISSDQDIKKDIGKPDVNLRERFQKQKKGSENEDRPIVDDTSETSEEILAHQRYLKDTKKDENSPATSNTKKQDRYSGGRRPNKITSNESVGSYSSTGFGHRDVSKSASAKKVTFSQELIRSSDLERSLDDFMPPRSDSADDPTSLDEILPTSIHNVMSLDDLIASEEFRSENEDDLRPTSALGFAGLHSVDELVPTDMHSTIEFAPSVQAETLSTDSVSDAAPNLMSNVRSLDDLMSSQSDMQPSASLEKVEPAIDKKPTGGVFRSRERDDESEVEEIVSESPNYTDDFDDTLRDTESIAEDVSEALTVSNTISTKYSQTSGSKSPDSSYSSSTITESSATPVMRGPPRKTVTTETQTDTSGKPWIPGLSFVDTAYFKPTRLVQGEILDVLSAQNPAAVALHDLLKQQLDLTREFISKARLLHDRAVDSIPKDYVYGQIDDARLERMKKIWYDDYDDEP